MTTLRFRCLPAKRVLRVSPCREGMGARRFPPPPRSANPWCNDPARVQTLGPMREEARHAVRCKHVHLGVAVLERDARPRRQGGEARLRPDRGLRRGSARRSTPQAIRERCEAAGIGATVCGAFGPDRDMSADDPRPCARTPRPMSESASTSRRRLGAKVVVGPMYSAVGRTRMAEPAERQAQRTLAADSIRECARYAARQRRQPRRRAAQPLRDRPDQHRGPGARPPRRDRPRRTSASSSTPST